MSARPDDIRPIIGRTWCASCAKWIEPDDLNAHNSAHVIVGDVYRAGRWEPIHDA